MFDLAGVTGWLVGWLTLRILENVWIWNGMGLCHVDELNMLLDI